MHMTPESTKQKDRPVFKYFEDFYNVIKGNKKYKFVSLVYIKFTRKRFENSSKDKQRIGILE